MASPFTLTNLLSHVSRDEWTPLSTALVRDGDPDPFTSLNREAWEQIDLYVRRYEVSEDVLVTHWRVLVFYFGFRRLSEPEEKWEKAFEETMKFLREVRDGKFKDSIPEKTTLPDNLPTHDAAWGSGKKFKTR